MTEYKLEFNCAQLKTHLGLNLVEIGNVESVKDRLDIVESGRVESGRVESGQVESGQVEFGLVESRSEIKFRN